MKAIENLPEGYCEIYSVDIQKDKKMAVFINILALLISILLIVPVHMVIPLYTMFTAGSPTQTVTIRLVLTLLLICVYMVLHELVHGIAMKICGTKKVKYGFTGMYAFACSNDYYNRKAYIFIALAPVVLWGIVIAIFNMLVPLQWFWIVYLIQIANLSGAAGDLFVTVRFMCFPRDILIRDYSVGMTVYSKNN